MVKYLYTNFTGSSWDSNFKILLIELTVVPVKYILTIELVKKIIIDVF